MSESKMWGLGGSNAMINRRRGALVGILSLIYFLPYSLYGRYSRSYMKQHHEPLRMTSTTVVNAKSDAKAAELSSLLRDMTRDNKVHSTNSTEFISAGSEEFQDAGIDGVGSIDNIGISLDIENDHEPYLSRWHRRFASSENRGKTGGYLFFKHIRKAGGTSLRAYMRDVLAYHGITRNMKAFENAKITERTGNKTDKYQIYYIEHEFLTMDSECPNVDPRWQESIQIIALRQPIERHLSEFFFSGPGFQKYFPIDKGQLYINKTYTDELAAFMDDWVPKWMKGIGKRKERDKGIEGKFNMIFGRQYTDNFQLRSLAGCTSEDCLNNKRVTGEQMDKVNQFHPTSHSYEEPVPRCTQYFRKEGSNNIFEQCAKPGHVKDHCSDLGCDGPCFYPSIAWGALDNSDLVRAISLLKQFDAVLLTEKLDEKDHSDFLSDILGVPRDAEFSLGKRHEDSNTGVKKTNKREKTHFYRDLMVKLGLSKLSQLLHDENKLEIMFYEHAEKLNELMIWKWKREEKQ